ncbi:MAG TPA: aminopeptidase [Solirubrobacteraceae bacterium]|nr:aminopeptidase [Solirubrobacteraceae bacterium]
MIAPGGPDPEAFAALVCDWCLRLEPGERVLVGSTTLAEEYALALHAAILDRDGWPFVALTPPETQVSFYAHARERHLSASSPIELALTEGLDAFVRIQAPGDTRELFGVDPTRIARAATAATALQERMRTLRWCLSLVPTPALAEQAGMALEPYAEFVTRALFLDRADPAGAWAELSARQDRLIAHLRSAREIHIEADGTDLCLDVTGRTWVNSDGRRNLPSGEVFTGPHEASAQGQVRFTVPTGPPGVTVTGVELEFRDGAVVAARADEGLEYLEATLDTDEGARRLGELGIGSNAGIDRPTGHILLDEKMAGTVHLALGRSYPETGAVNASAVHWDLICDLRDGGRLSADGVAVIDGGRVVV